MKSLSALQQQRRQFRLFSWTGAGLVAAILIVLNFIASYFSIRLDTSEGQVYSISRGSKEILKKLDDTLLVKIMFTQQLPPPYRINEKYLSDLLTEYKRAAHGKIRIEYFDPSESTKARQEALSHGIVPVQLDVRERDRREVKECFMGVSFLYGDKKGSIPIIQDSQNLEYEITVQIKKLIDPEKVSIGVAKVAGAMDFSNESLQPLTQAINQLYSPQVLDLTSPIPSSIKSVWLMGPNRTLESTEIGHLRNYLAQGGTLGLLLDKKDVVVSEFRTSPLQTGMDDFLSEWGLGLKDGLVVDPRCDRIQVRAVQGAFQMINIVDYPYIPVVIDLDRSHPTTKGLEAFTMPYVAPIEIKERKPNLTYTVIGRSSEMSYLDTLPISVNPIQERVRPPNATDGPFDLITLVEGQFDSVSSTATKPGRLILFGSSRFIRSDYPVKQSNYSLFMNMIDWAAQDDVLMQIRSKGLAQKPLKRISDGIRLLLKSLMIFFLPVLTLILGFIIWHRQKMRRALLPLEYQI